MFINLVHINMNPPWSPDILISMGKKRPGWVGGVGAGGSSNNICVQYSFLPISLQSRQSESE